MIKSKEIDNNNRIKLNLIKARNSLTTNRPNYNRFNILSDQELIEDNKNEADDICREVIEMEEEMATDMILDNNFLPNDTEHPSIINNLTNSKRSSGSRTSSPEPKFSKKSDSPSA